jgi:TPR repeat protein
MVAEPARSRSAELIDFEQARSLYSKQQHIQSKLGALIELEALIVRQFQTDLPSPSSEILASSPVARILAAIRDSESRSIESCRDVDQPVTHPLFKEFGRELRRIEERLDDIDARISALTAPAPRNIIDLEHTLRARAKEIDPSPIEAAPPPRAAHIASVPGLDSPPAQDTDNAPREKGSAPKDGAQHASSAMTVEVIDAPSPRASHRKALHRLQRQLTQLWRKLQARLRRVHAAAAPLMEKSATGVPSAESLAWPINGMQNGKRWLGAGADRLARRLGATSTRALAWGASLLVLGGYFLLIGPKPVGTTQMPLAVNHMEEWRAPDARAAAAAKAAAPPALAGVKINSLQTTVALLSPEPISGGVSGARIGLTPPAGESPKSAPAPVAPAPVEAAARQPVAAPTDAQTLPQGDTDLLDARAAGGDAEAQYDYATELYKSGDTKDAVSWLQKSAKQGNAKAQLQLGNLYLKGTGVARNFAQARKWLEAAANNGNPLAMHNLAVLYGGSEGRKPDYVRASDWFRRAAEQGVVDSMFNLGLAYADGLGVEKDIIQAYAWFSVLASQGDAKAAQKRKELGKFLDREELSEAKALADSLKLAQRSR